MGIHNVQVDLTDAVYEDAVRRAAAQGKSIEQLAAEFLTRYAAGVSSGDPTTYTVQRCDTLGRIAARFYGDARKYPIIQRVNNISNPSRIWVGQVLIIPPVDGTLSRQTPPPPAVALKAPPIISSAVAAPVPVVKPTISAGSTTLPPASPLPISAGPVAGKPSIRWVGSPNFNNRRRPDDITAIVIHATANSSIEHMIERFNDPNSQVSAHYTITKDGTIFQHVHDMHRAWHTGRSSYKGRQACDDFTLGIELVNLNDGTDTYPEIQHQVNVELCTHLCQKHSVSSVDIVGHLDVAIPPGRKSDPRGYDLNRLRKDVAVRMSSG